MWCAAVGVNIMMNEVYIVWSYYSLPTLSYDIYPEYFIDDFMIGLSDDNDLDIADNRILPEWRVLLDLYSKLSLLQVISRTCCYHRGEDP